MRTFIKQFLVGFTIILLSFSANAEDKSVLVEDASAALQSLYKNVPESVSLSNKAAAILVFPKIVRAGFIAGGSGGEGVLFKKGKARGYYSSGSISVGLQAGVQSFGYAVFFMTERELKAFQRAMVGTSVPHRRWSSLIPALPRNSTRQRPRKKFMPLFSISRA